MTPPIPSDDHLDALMSEPILDYDPAVVDAALDRIAELQGPDRDIAIAETVAAMPVWTLPSTLLEKTEDK